MVCDLLGVLSKSQMSKSEILDGLCWACHYLETVKDISGECSFAKWYWWYAKDQNSTFFQDRLHPHAVVFGNGRCLICFAFFGIS